MAIKYSHRLVQHISNDVNCQQLYVAYITAACYHFSISVALEQLRSVLVRQFRCYRVTLKFVFGGPLVNSTLKSIKRSAMFMTVENLKGISYRRKKQAG